MEENNCVLSEISDVAILGPIVRLKYDPVTF
jgi:hypothetical protein